MEKFLPPRTDQVGFTLIEQLISLTIFIILTLLLVPMTFNRMHDIEEQQFFEVLSNDILYVQNLALKYPDTYSRLRIFDAHYEILSGHNLKDSIKRPLPKQWKVSSRNLKEISFSKNGTIRY